MIFILDDWFKYKIKDSIVCRSYNEAIQKWDDSIFYEYVLIDYDLDQTLKIKEADKILLIKNRNLDRGPDFYKYFYDKYNLLNKQKINYDGLDFYNFIKNKKNFYKIIYESSYCFGSKYREMIKDPRVNLIPLRYVDINKIYEL